MKLWNKNFFLLCQGQFVSEVGNALYGIALGFFILNLTGSTAIMGTTMDIAAIPRIFLSPVAGTFVDRHNRKMIIVMSDFISGIAILTLGLLAYFSIVEVWMVVLVGVITSITGVYFNPAMQSSLPEIVSKEKLLQANSIFELIRTSSDILGKLIGGLLFSILGGPFIFILNGLSYLFSGMSELFIRIPAGGNEAKKNTFYHDLKDGFRYFVKNKGLRYLYIFIAPLNLFGVMTFTLLLPLFNTVEYLGAAAYGFAMTGAAVGMFASHSIVSSNKFSQISKVKLFLLSGLMNAGSMIVLALIHWLPLMILMMFISGFSVALTNTLILTALQTAIPADKRGRVLGFRRMLNGSLVPIAMASAGILAEFVSISFLIVVSNILLLVIFILVVRIPIINDFINGIQEEKVA